MALHNIVRSYCLGGHRFPRVSLSLLLSLARTRDKRQPGGGSDGSWACL